MAKTQLARMTVVRTEQIAASMRRVVLGGDGFDRIHAGLDGHTDAYVKLAFLAEGFDYPEEIDLDEIRRTMPPAAWPVLRTYTIRHVDPDAREIVIDFVTHGDVGLAGPWAERAEPGDVIHLRGPGGAYAPRPDADVHLLVGDEAAWPAIAATLEALAPGQRAVAFVEVDGPADELPIATAGDVELTWLHRGGAPAGSTTLLDDAVRAWEWPEGRVQAFVHGESALLKTVRPYLATERGIDRADLSISAYWRRGETEEGFRAWKQAQAAAGEETILRPQDRT